MFDKILHGFFTGSTRISVWYSIKKTSRRGEFVPPSVMFLRMAAQFLTVSSYERLTISRVDIIISIGDIVLRYKKGVLLWEERSARR